MKSRISTTYRQRKQRSQRTRALRNETLEARCLLAADFGLADALIDHENQSCFAAQAAEGERGEGESDQDAILRSSLTSWLPIGFSQQDFRDFFQSGDGEGGNGGGGNGGGGNGGESEGNRQVVNEIEPNNSSAQAQLLDISTLPGRMRGIDVLGTGVLDVDYFAVELRAGDIIGMNLLPEGAGGAVAGTLDLYTSGNQTLVTSGLLDVNGIGSPAESPLPKGGIVSSAYVIGQAGTYYLSVTNPVGDYRLNVDLFRPTLEEQAIGAKQTIFLDFDGASIDNSIFLGTLGQTVNLTGLDGFLPNWGLGTNNRDAVIDATIAEFKAVFDQVRATGFNGDFDATGINGQFDIEILNSRDHADPFGQPNVSRVIIGGTQLELGIPTIGIAESIDVGNFKTNESAVVLLDALSDPAGGGNSINDVFRAPGIPISAAIGRVVGIIAAHEVGHYTGVWHTDPNPIGAGGPGLRSIMDNGGGSGTIPQTAGGVGPDGVFGTTDDNPLRFVTDIYSTLEFLSGTEDTEDVISGGMSTGGIFVPVPGTVNGVKFQDVNRNGVRDGGEPGLANFVIFSDLDADGLRDADEPFATTRADGSYSLSVGDGVNRIAEEQQAGWEQTFPAAPFHLVNVPPGGTVNNINFGNARVVSGVRGVVYHDLNGDGDQQVNEPGLDRILVFADVDNDRVVDITEPRTFSDATGRYSLDLPIFGNYTIRQTPPPGWTQTEPTSNAGIPISVVSGQVVSGVDFGNSGKLYDYGNIDDGARAGILPGFQLGPTITGEALPRIGADDSDGVTFSPGLFAGQPSTLTVDVRLGGQSLGYFNGFIDFNMDGQWSSDEQVVKNLRLREGLHTVEFAVPSDAVAGAAAARFRYGFERDITATGEALAGEIEDYNVVIFGDNPVANDDRFDGPNSLDQGDVNVFLDVLANDFPSSNGPLRVQSATSPTASGGTVIVPANGLGVLYTPDASFFGTDTFQYTVVDGAGNTDTATVLVRVQPQFSGPIAIDDSELTAINLPVDVFVLENDLGGPFEPAELRRISSPPSHGSAFVDDNGTTNPIDDFVTYSPAPGFQGADQFQYEIIDQAGQTSRAIVTIYVGDAFSDDIVEYSVSFTDAMGGPITSVDQGDTFYAVVYVQDLRDRNEVPPLPPGEDRRGVFAAYTDLIYSRNVAVIGDPEFIGPYTSVPEFDTFVPGLIDEMGAFQTFDGNIVPDPLGADQFIVARIPFRAVQSGEATFRPDPADAVGFIDPATGDYVFGPHDTLLTEPETFVPLDGLRFIADSLTIDASPEGEASGFHNRFRPTDVTADFQTDTRDVLSIVSYLYRNGSQTLSPGGTGIGLYLDVNNDFTVSPFDALRVISYLRSGPPAGEGEGEGEASLVQAPANQSSDNDTEPFAFITAIDQDDAEGESGAALDAVFAAAGQSQRPAQPSSVGGNNQDHDLEEDFYADILNAWK